jgi:hypothetical protein
VCIEVYHPQLPVVIRYANETLRFEGPQSIKACYAFLLQNSGHARIDCLNVLFPRPLYLMENGEWLFSGVRDLVDEIPNRLEDCYPIQGSNLLRLVRPDPNRPQFDMPPLEGEWIPKKTPLAVPSNIFSQNELKLLMESGLSFFQVDLHESPIEPWASRWFCWEVISSKEVGILRESPFGRIAIHQLASPCAVRHTVEEHFEVMQYASEKLALAGDFLDDNIWMSELCKHLLKEMGLLSERRVDIQLFELVIQPGKQHFIISWDVERDLRMHAGSPREARNSPYEPAGELIYEWKTGSLLNPSRNPWWNGGFTLHLTLACS